MNDEYSNQMVIIIMHYALIIMNYYLGGLAQLARAPALQAGGQRFESVILHIEGILGYLYYASYS